MMANDEQLKQALKRQVIVQKQNLKYRLISPSLFFSDLIRAEMRCKPIRVALISDLDAWSSEAQFDPFSTHRADLRQELGLVWVRLMLKDIVRGPRFIISLFDIVIIKLSYRTDASDAINIVQRIRKTIGHKRLLYFDGDDDVCIQWPEIITYVDLYVKKHMFCDLSKYLQTFTGKSNLHDYVCKKHNHVLTARDYGAPWDKTTMIAQSGPVPESQLDKIYLGVGMAEDKSIFNLYKILKDKSMANLKNFDIVFRGSIARDTIVYYLRRDIEPILRGMVSSFSVILPDKRVSRNEYYAELQRSRISVSPFGFGEVCYRDFESVLFQCLLIKPDMSHVNATPNIYQPFETYVPVKWDFSDLQEKCEYYLRNEVERQRIVNSAYDVLDKFYKNRGFVQSIRRMLGRLELLSNSSEAPV